MPKPKHIPQNAWDKAQELLKTAPGMWKCPSSVEVGFSKICAGGYISADGEQADSAYGWNGYVCHAFIQQNQVNHPLLFNTMVKVGTPELQKAVDAFCKWSKEESPYRKFILNDTLESMSHGGIIIDFVKCPGHIALLICKLFRCAYEDTFRLPIWHGLVERGVHPMIALCFSQCCDSSLSNNGRQTHNTCLQPPKDNEDAKDNLLGVDHLSERKTERNTWGTYDIFGGCEYDDWAKTPMPFPDEKHATQKIPDGWGGFVEKKVPVSLETAADLLKKWEKELKK